MKVNKFFGSEQIAGLTFDTPTQVCFHSHNEDPDTPACGGIAYNDYVICACCGGIVPMDEIEYLVVYDNWVDFSEEITETEDRNIDLDDIVDELSDEDEWDALYDSMADLGIYDEEDE